MNDAEIPEIGEKSQRVVLSGWKEVTEAFDSFPAPKLDFDPDLEVTIETTWIFRGHKKAAYPLKPSIEREPRGKDVSWAKLESMVLREFKSKAPMLIAPSDVPSEKLGWLALMQHYGVSTRLLDFTFSPYVALYFALRDRAPQEEPEPKPAGLWAINASALMRVAEQKSREADKRDADKEEQSRNSASSATQQNVEQRRGIMYMLENARTPSDRVEYERGRKLQDILVSKALEPTDIRRDYFNSTGFVAFAPPPTENRRLSSQQGTFLFSAAEDDPFEKSLGKMMNGHPGEWSRQYQIPRQALPEIERRLFQMNIHDLSLFPDMEGLAGLIRQKARLHWGS
ncbi:MAG TPA: FRG domain-containing protein [Terriglobia bacterium]|nr:FRG domain-containing protein [Terriglobia bacterium]